MLIRTATESDCPAIAAVYRHHVETSVATFDEVAPDEAFWRTKLAGIQRAGWPFLAVSDDAQLGGYAYVAPWHSRPAYARTVEDSIYLDPACAGKGLGTRLLRELLDQAAGAGAREVVAVIADTGSAASSTLHERAGFVRVGTLTGVGFKHGRWIDVTLMQTSLRCAS